MTLNPGDVITGMPAGVGFKRTPPVPAAWDNGKCYEDRELEDAAAKATQPPGPQRIQGGWKPRSEELRLLPTADEP